MTTGEFVVPRALARVRLEKPKQLIRATLSIFRHLALRDSWAAGEPCPPGECTD